MKITWDDPAGGAVAVAGLRVRSLLSAELFRDMAGLSSQNAGELAAACQTRWIALADALAALAEPVEVILLIGSAAPEGGRRPVSQTAFLAVGRAETSDEAQARAAGACRTLQTLLETTLDYAEPAAGDPAPPGRHARRGREDRLPRPAGRLGRG